MIDWDNDQFLKPRLGQWWYPAYDKLGHFICHFFAMLLSIKWIMSLIVPILSYRGKIALMLIFWMLIGVAYEFVWDRRRGRKPSWKDIVANSIGQVVAVVIWEIII